VPVEGWVRDRAPGEAHCSRWTSLLALDDAAVMSLLEFGLCQRGVELFALANRTELEAFARSGMPVDAALIDLSPIADDPDRAISMLRRHSPGLSVFLISGTTVTSSAHQHVAGWIRKPFELGEIFHALGQARDL